MSNVSVLVDFRAKLEKEYKGPNAAYIIGCFCVTIFHMVEEGRTVENIYRQLKDSIDMLSEIEYKIS